MDTAGTSSRAGFGFLHDGRVDSLTRFLVDGFGITDNQQIADLTACLLSFSGSGLDRRLVDIPNESKDAPAAIGKQITLRAPNAPRLLYDMVELADNSQHYADAFGASIKPRPDLIASSSVDGLPRGWFYDRERMAFQSDRHTEERTLAEVIASASPTNPITFTMVPGGTGKRVAIDRDDDGYFDRTEVEAGLDPTDPRSLGTNRSPSIGPGPYEMNVNTGETLPLDLRAIDPDSPQSTLPLTFSGRTPRITLDPSGAVSVSIDPGDTNSLYDFAVKATDPDWPFFSAAQRITMHVYPNSFRIIRLQRNGPSLFLEFYARSGSWYQLQATGDLNQPVWTTVDRTFVPVDPRPPQRESEGEFSVEIAEPSIRFFRIQSGYSQ